MYNTATETLLLGLLRYLRRYRWKNTYGLKALLPITEYSDDRENKRIMGVPIIMALLQGARRASKRWTEKNLRAQQFTAWCKCRYRNHTFSMQMIKINIKFVIIVNWQLYAL